MVDDRAERQSPAPGAPGQYHRTVLGFGLGALLGGAITLASDGVTWRAAGGGVVGLSLVYAWWRWLRYRPDGVLETDPGGTPAAAGDAPSPAGGASPGPSSPREWASRVGELALCVLLGVGCAFAPMAAAGVHPLAGVFVAVGSFWVWGRFGPPPMHSFLNLSLCLWGHGAILASLIACIQLAVR